MVRLLDACDGIRVGSLPMSRSSLPFMLLWAVLLLAPVQALADELHGRGSAAFATTEDPQNPTTRYLVAFTDHANGDVKVGSWTSAGGNSCGMNGFVSTTALPTTAGMANVVEYSSVSISRSGLLAVTAFTSLSPVVGHVFVLAHTGNDSCAGWGGSWIDIGQAGSDIPISAPATISWVDGSDIYEYVAVEARASTSQYFDLAFRKWNGSSWSNWGWSTGLSSLYNSQPALAMFNGDMYIYGIADADPTVVSESHALSFASGGEPNWASSGSSTGLYFVNSSGLYYPTACSATASTDTLLVVCGDNQNPMHYWANVYNGSGWSSSTTWYDQGSPSFVHGGVTRYADTRPAAGFFGDYGTSWNFMLIGASNSYSYFMESDYTTSWSGWASRSF